MTQNQFSDLERLEAVAKRIQESQVDLTAQYDDWVNITLACASLGEAAREAYHIICSVYPRYSRQECDAKFDNCLKTGRGMVTLGTLMQAAKDAGIDISMPRGRRPLSEQKRKEEQKNRMRLIMEYFRQKYTTRFNTWKGRVEIREQDQKWKPLDDRDLSTIFCRLNEAGVNVKMPEVRFLLESRDYSEDYDAVKTYLNSLVPWNPDTDPDYIREFFINHLEFNDPENVEFYCEMFKKWFVCMVALWYGIIDENPIMLVFCGTQHIGKTYFIRHILPPELREYFKVVLPCDPVDKDFIISLAEVIMLFLDEFGITSNLKSDTYKAIITSNQSNLRDAYAHFREVRKRKASLIGATNYKQFIRDAEGNRRYVGVDLKSTVDLNEHPLPYEGAYAQALYLINHGFDPKPTHEESMLISQHNQAFMEPNDCEEALMTIIKRPDETDTKVALSAGELMRELRSYGFQGREFNTVEIGKNMSRMGFERKRINGINKYLVAKVNQTMRELTSKEDAKEFTPEEA